MLSFKGKQFNSIPAPVEKALQEVIKHINTTRAEIEAAIPEEYIPETYAMTNIATTGETLTTRYSKASLGGVAESFLPVATAVGQILSVVSFKAGGWDITTTGTDVIRAQATINSSVTTYTVAAGTMVDFECVEITGGAGTWIAK